MNVQRKKIRVAVIFGGKSAEHEVSLQSAKNIVDALDKKKYDIALIKIDKQGRWHKSRANDLLTSEGRKFVGSNKRDAHAIIPSLDSQAKFIDLADKENLRIDVVFPVLHGPFGEDGTVQGLFKLSGIPFVGAGVLGSAVAMDKDVMKRLFAHAGLPTPKHLAFRRLEKINFIKVKKALGMPLFIKPANLGSSIGISKACNEKEFITAIEEAFKYDTKILIEEFIEGSEIECSVLGNEDPETSVLGEVLPKHEFYSYEAKYIDENGAEFIIPAKLSKAKTKEVQALAIKAFKVLCLEGMARADLFLTQKGKVYLNEVNTIPGFTKISMYPKMWEASGLPYPKLIDRLIELALERFKKESKLKTDYVR
jgi:D-alanine-D-alanine ligase